MSILDYKILSDSYTLDTNGAGFTLGYPIWEKIRGYVGYNFTMTDLQVVEGVIAPPYIQEGQRTGSAVTLSLVRDTTNDNMFPTKGTNTSISVQHFGPPLGWDIKFTKYSAGATAYYPLFWDMVFGSKGRI